MRPVIIINFKTYPAATGKNAVKLAKICAAVAKKHRADIRIAVQAADIYRVAAAVSIPVYAQHVDGILSGKNTGFILAEDVKAEGAVGTLLNHSEHQLSRKALTAAVQRAKEAGLKIVLCAPTPKAAQALVSFHPEFIAVEPPSLIGTTTSVSTAKPAVIKDAVKLINAPLLVGAGIHTGEDVRIALKLGAKGVLLSSGITQAKNPKKVLEGLLSQA